MSNKNEGERTEFRPINYDFLNPTNQISELQPTSETSETSSHLKTAIFYEIQLYRLLALKFSPKKSAVKFNAEFRQIFSYADCLLFRIVSPDCLLFRSVRSDAGPQATPNRWRHE